MTTMAKGAKVKPDDLPPLGPPPPESDKKAMKAWVKETNKRKKAKVKVDMKAKKQRDKRKRASGPVKPKNVRQQHLKERRAFLS